MVASSKRNVPPEARVGGRWVGNRGGISSSSSGLCCVGVKKKNKLEVFDLCFLFFFFFLLSIFIYTVKKTNMETEKRRIVQRKVLKTSPTCCRSKVRSGVCRSWRSRETGRGGSKFCRIKCFDFFMIV